MTTDPFSAFKDRQREVWASFAPAATFSTPGAAHLVKFAGIQAGETVLDVGCGTGVVAKENARTAALPEVEFTEGDVEHLPYPDASFDVVLSQFGHMFAPRPELAVAEMRRVLKPAGRIAFSTWPPDNLVGEIFAFIGRNSPPPPPGIPPPSLWGDESVIKERLAPAFGRLEFERGALAVPALSLQHYRTFMEHSVGPLQKLIESLADSPERVAEVRREFETICAPYYADNHVRQEYLMTRATNKRP